MIPYGKPAHAELAGDLDHAQIPGYERPERAEGDPLPQAAAGERREAEPVFEIRRRDVDLPNIPGRSDRGAVDDQGGADDRKEHRGDAKKADVERPDPEVEQVPADQRTATYAVLVFKIHHGH
jgi:hypothetical protein